MSAAADAFVKKYGLVKAANKGGVCAVARSGKRALVDELRAAGFGNFDVAENVSKEYRVHLSEGSVRRHSAKHCGCWAKS